MAMTLKIGNRLKATVASLKEAQTLYCTTRDASGEGASTFPTGSVNNLTISYNGRLWDRNGVEVKS